MAVKRTIYALILLSAVAVFIATDSNIALFLLVGFLALPAFSLVLLFVARNRVTVSFQARESCIRGGALELVMKVRLAPRMLAGCVRVAAEIENTTFGKITRKVFVFRDLSFSPHLYRYESADSGRISIRLASVRLVDIFGLFAVEVKSTAFAESLVSPKLYEDILVRMSADMRNTLSGATPLLQKGNDNTETYCIRDYAGGDSLNSVHWKLSSKFDSLKVKEFGSTDDRTTLILVDMSRDKYGVKATDEQLNTVLDVAASVSGSLKESTGHSVGWFEDGVFRCNSVADNDTFVKMVYDLMSIKVKAGNAEELFYFARSPECSAFTKIVFVTTSIHPEELKHISGVNVTAVVVGDGTGELEENGVKIINVPCDRVGDALAWAEL